MGHAAGNRGGRARLVVGAIAVCMAVVAPSTAEAAPAAGPSDNPFERGFDQLFDDMGADFPVAVGRAIDRGHSGTQVVSAIAVEGLADGGTLSTPGARNPSVTPVFAPAGIIEGDGDGPGTVAPAEVRRAARQTALESLNDEELTARPRDRDALAAALILGAALAGYSAEQIILDGLLSEDSRVAMGGLLSRREGTAIIDKDGVIKPDHTVVRSGNTEAALGRVLEEHTAPAGSSGSPTGNEEPKRRGKDTRARKPSSPKNKTGTYRITFEGHMEFSATGVSMAIDVEGSGTVSGSRGFLGKATGDVSATRSTQRDGSCSAQGSIPFSVSGVQSGSRLEVEMSSNQLSTSKAVTRSGSQQCLLLTGSGTGLAWDPYVRLGFPAVTVPVKGGSASGSDAQGGYSATITLTLTPAK